MDSHTIRILAFLIGCIGTRTLFVYVAKNAGQKYLPLLGYLALLPALGFIYIYLIMLFILLSNFFIVFVVEMQ